MTAAAGARARLAAAPLACMLVLMPMHASFAADDWMTAEALARAEERRRSTGDGYKPLPAGIAKLRWLYEDGERTSQLGGIIVIDETYDYLGYYYSYKLDGTVTEMLSPCGFTSIATARDGRIERDRRDYDWAGWCGGVHPMEKGDRIELPFGIGHYDVTDIVMTDAREYGLDREVRTAILKFTDPESDSSYFLHSADLLGSLDTYSDRDKGYLKPEIARFEHTGSAHVFARCIVKYSVKEPCACVAEVADEVLPLKTRGAIARAARWIEPVKVSVEGSAGEAVWRDFMLRSRSACTFADMSLATGRE